MLRTDDAGDTSTAALDAEYWRAASDVRSPMVFHKSRVVVVDDVAANVALLKRILVAAGIGSVETFTNAKAALDHCVDSPPDLLLLDLHMPGLDGLAVLASLQSRLRTDVFLPVIVLTADVTRDARQRVLAAGAKDFLAKPLDPLEVLFRVRNMLETTHLYRAVSNENAFLQAIVEDKTAADRRAAGLRRMQRRRIKRAVTSDALSMVFQPIVDIGSGQVVGVEALARFSCGPTRPPNEWFAEAAEVGVGPNLELRAVRMALSQLSSLPPPLFMSVNVSPATAVDPELSRLTAVDPGRVVVELTEHVPLDEYPTIVEHLSALKSHGVRIAIDDAGSGYSGLALLVRLSPDIIKLDRYLVTGIANDPCRRALASAFVAFARDIDASLIAEGIEDARELALLRALGVPWGQGYHLGRPSTLPLLKSLVDAR